MNLLNEEQLKEAVKDSFEKMKESLSNEVLNELKSSMKWNLQDLYKEQIIAFFKAEIMPELALHLKNSKAEFLKQMTETSQETAKQFADMISKKLIEEFTNSSWKAKKIMDDLF